MPPGRVGGRQYTDGPSKRGKQSQSTEPSRLTSAAERQSGSSAYSPIGKLSIAVPLVIRQMLCARSGCGQASPVKGEGCVPRAHAVLRQVNRPTGAIAIMRTESGRNGGDAGGMTTPQPFYIDTPQADLDDLAGRLARTRWPDELSGTGWDYGVARDRVREVAAYWHQGYDWRAQAARLNAIPQFTTVIDGQQIHFLHLRGGTGLPLLLCHGWPSTPADFLELAARWPTRALTW